jgi:hypothetical protein
MPTYAARCTQCKREFEYFVAKIDERNDTPDHCGVKAERIMNAPMVAPLFTDYRAIAGDRRYIRTRQEHKDFLREFGYEEVGNDLSYYPTETDEEREAKDRDTFAQLNQLASPDVQAALESTDVPGSNQPGNGS